MLGTLASAQEIDSYLDCLTSEQVVALVAETIAQLGSTYRAQLVLYLGCELSPDNLEEDLRNCPLLRERFAAFLRDNPGALTPAARGPLHTKPARIALASLLAIALAIAPLAAQYLHQQGMVSVPEPAIAAPQPRHAMVHRPVAPSHTAVRARALVRSFIGRVSPNARMHFVTIRPAPGGRTKVAVDVYGRHGAYFEVFYLAARRAGMRIVGRHKFPMNRTATARVEKTSP